jgi:FdhE protein
MASGTPKYQKARIEQPVIKEATSKIYKKLSKKEKEEGSLPLLLEFYKKLTNIQAKTQKSIGLIEPTITREEITRRLKYGTPLVKFEELAIDRDLARATFGEIVTLTAEYPQLFGEIPERLKGAKGSSFLTKKAIETWFKGKTLPQRLTEGISNNLIQFIIQATMQPFLNKHASALIDQIEGDEWRRNYCPICGGIPDLAYLDKDVGARGLVCSRCDAEWPYQRLQCPYCKNVDQPTLHFLEDEEKGVYRLYCCDKCHTYLKAIDLRKTEDEVLLPLERIYTIDLDIQARKQGYHTYGIS